MCQAVQEMIDDARREERLDIAKTMIHAGAPVQFIRRVSNVSMEDLERLAQEENLPLVQTD